MAYPDPCLLRNVSIPTTKSAIRQGEHFTQYAIIVEGYNKKWEVRRRYSDFYYLHQTLCYKYPTLVGSVDFPEKTLFNTSPQVIEDRRKRLERYLKQVTMISIPSNSCGGLNRMREIDLFLEVARHMSAAPQGDRPSWKRSWTGTYQINHRPTPEFAASKIANSSKSSRKAQYEELRGILVQYMERQIKNMQHCDTASWIKMFITDCLGYPRQDPLEQLSRVREFIEDLAEYFVEKEYENLNLMLQDWRVGLSKQGGDQDTSSQHKEKSKAFEPFDVDFSTPPSRKKMSASEEANNGTPNRSINGASLHVSRKAVHLLSSGNTPHTRKPLPQVPSHQEEEDMRFFCICAREVIERHVVLPQASDLIYRAQQVVGAADFTVKEKLDIIRQNFGGIQPELFGAPEILTFIYENPGMESEGKRPAKWDEPIAQLMAMEQSPLPSQMKERLLEAVSCIQEEAQINKEKNSSNTPEEGLGADEFLPLFLYVLALADLDRPATCYSFLQHLLPSPDNTGEAAYYLTTLESAVHFLMRISLAEVKGEVCVLLTPYPASPIVSHENTIKSANIIYPSHMKGAHSADISAGFEEGTNGRIESAEDFVLPAQQLVFSAALGHPLFRPITRYAVETLLRILASKYWEWQKPQEKYSPGEGRATSLAKKALEAAAAGQSENARDGTDEIYQYLRDNSVSGVWVLYPGPLRQPSYICAAFLLRTHPFGNREWIYSDPLVREMEENVQWKALHEDWQLQPTYVLLHQRSPREYFFQVPFWSHADAHWTLNETHGRGSFMETCSTTPYNDLTDESFTHLVGSAARYVNFKGPFANFHITIQNCIRYYENGLFESSPAEPNPGDASIVSPNALNGSHRTKSTGDVARYYFSVEYSNQLTPNGADENSSMTSGKSDVISPLSFRGGNGNRKKAEEQKTTFARSRSLDLSEIEK